jgi:PIF1-like helicase/Helicase
LAALCISTLNADQRAAYDAIMHAVNTQSGESFFLNGPGGTGKTYVYNTLCYSLRSHANIVICTASSGIAATLLLGGCTAHFRFKIPIKLHEGSTCGISKNSMEAELLRQTNLIIIDEITMQHRHAAEAIDRLLQDIKGSDRLFRGLTVVFGGDFQQILPVIPKGSRPQIVGACIQRSNIWRHLRILNLTVNMRLQVAQDEEERNFAKWQLEVGHGKHTDKDGNIDIPEQFHCPQNTVESLISTIYPGVTAMPHPHDNYFSERSILSARNTDVDDLNKRILDSFPGLEKVYHSADSIKEMRDEEGAQLMYPTEYLNSINASGLPLSKLTLKKGCPVMVLRNLNPQEGVCNGTRGIITRMANRVIEIRILGGSFAGNTIFIPRLKIEPSDTQLPFQLCRLQYPLRLAFAMTINKAQGQSLNNVGIDFRSPIFTHGQFYVAVSRATSVHRIKLIWPPDSPPKTKNIVFPEVLLD